METKLILGNSILPVTPAEMRVFLCLDSTVTDTDLTEHIKSATDLFEKMTGHILLKKQYKTTLSMESYNYCDLPYSPIIQIIACESNGETIPATDYEILGGRFTLLNVHLSSRIEITYEAGYQTESDIPPIPKNSIMQMVGDFYFYKGTEAEKPLKNHFLSFYKVRLF